MGRWAGPLHRDDGDDDEGEVIGLLQVPLPQVSTPRARGRRPQKWIQALDDLRHMTHPTEGGRATANMAESQTAGVCALAGMFRNVSDGPSEDACDEGLVSLGPEITNYHQAGHELEDESEEVTADSMAERIVHGFETEWQAILEEADDDGDVTPGMALEVARRLDRRVGEPEPAGIDPVSGEVMDRENMTVGLTSRVIGEEVYIKKCYDRYDFRWAKKHVIFDGYTWRWVPSK